MNQHLKSIFSKNCRAISVWSCLILALGLLCKIASADVIVVGPPKKPNIRPASAAVTVDEATTGLPKRAEKKRTLRCWQNGLLIVERRIEQPPEDANRIVRIGSADDLEAQLFDLRNSTCLLQ